MSIEQKIAKLLEDSKKLQEESKLEEGLTVEEYEALSDEEKVQYINEAVDHQKMADQHAHHSERHELEASNDGHPDHDHASTAHANAEAAHKEAAKKLKQHGADSEHYKKAAAEAATATRDAKDESSHLKFKKVSKPHPFAEASSCYKKVVKEETEEVQEELKVDVSEDVAALINGEDLTEEFKTKAATIFEAAVVTRVKAEIAKIEEQFDSKLAEQVEEIKEGIVEQVDGYLNYVVEQWMTDNELALENGIKAEILESFVSGMKGLFEQHYIDMPEEKFDLLGELEEQVEDVKSKLDDQLAANVELTKKINEMTRASTIAEASSGMADTDAEKFNALAEELSFEDVDTFKSKLQTIKENYFGKKVAPSVNSPVTDEPVTLTEEKAVDPIMAHYLRALKK
jgi:hypothetical protein